MQFMLELNKTILFSSAILALIISPNSFKA